MYQIFKSFLFFLLFFLGVHQFPAECAWLETDYLFWAFKKSPLPVPLVTSASLDDPLPGALGQPGTKILMGDKGIDMRWRNGFRVALGTGIECCSCLGVEANFFLFPQKSHHQSIQTSGEPGSLNVAVPIYDVTGLWGLKGVPGETVFILPGPLEGPGFKGRFSLKVTSKLQGSELNVLATMIDRCSFSIDVLAGIRWLQLQESLSFVGKTAALPNAPIAEGFYNFKDSFSTNNNFYGPQFGLKANYKIDRWLLKGFAKIALGCMNQSVRIHGKSQTSDGNLFYMTKNTAHEVLAGGIFSEPTNQGTHHHNRFAIVCEANINIAYQFTHWFELGVGYNFLWANQLLYPGKQIDRKINPTRTSLAQASRRSVGIGPDTPIPFGESASASLPTGPKRPHPKHRSTDLWAQGLIISFNVKF